MTTNTISFSQSLDRLKESFLWAAAQGGNAQDCESLLEIGAKVNWKNSEGDAPIHAASRRGHSDTITLLLVHGADVNLLGGDAKTSLQIAVERGDIRSVNILLDANASINFKTKEGLSILDIAKSKGYKDIFNRLKQQKIGNISRLITGRRGNNSIDTAEDFEEVTLHDSNELSSISMEAEAFNELSGMPGTLLPSLVTPRAQLSAMSSNISLKLPATAFSTQLPINSTLLNRSEQFTQMYDNISGTTPVSASRGVGSSSGSYSIQGLHNGNFEAVGGNMILVY